MGISQTIEEARRRAAAIPRARTGGAASGPATVPARPDNRPAPRTPSQRRLVGLCGWAALLGFLGVIVGARGLVAILVKAPDWYEPTVVILGLSGIGLTVLAFLTVHQRYVPWLFLTLASGVLLTSIIATGEAT